MGHQKYTEEQVIGILREGEGEPKSKAFAVNTG